MMTLWKISIWIFAAFVASTQAIGFRGLTYDGRKEPEVDGHGIKTLGEKWIRQPVDHFNTRDNRTWLMRYYENDEMFNGTGPMFIMLGGEWTIAPGFLQSGQMYEIAKIHGAMMFYTEHRFYGKSRPVNDTSAKNLQYLSVDQALADVAYFIEEKKIEIHGLLNADVIVFGGSYAGNMAAWARLKYPHLIQGALASSAPVRAKADFFEYLEVVSDSLKRYNEQCIVDVKEAFNSVETLLGVADGPGILKTMFNLCDAPKSTDATSVGFFMNGLAEHFAGSVQYNKMGINESTISKLCDKMMNVSDGSPIMRLGKIMSSEKCTDVSYDNFVEVLAKTSWEAVDDQGIMRLWYYQTCTEYGYYQTTSSPKSIFGGSFPLGFWTRLCSDLYGDFYNSKLLDRSVKRTNLIYGGSLPDMKNVIFVNGKIDPWHPLSVLEDLHDKSPAILIDGSSHCEDLYDDMETDVPELKRARIRVRSIIAGWLNPTY